MKKLCLVLLILLQVAYAQNFDFNTVGNKSANDILKNYLEKEYNIEDIDVCAFFYDINQNGNKDILGIAKTSIFHSLGGYKLIVLRNENSEYIAMNSNITFDNTKNVNIENNKVTYYKNEFYKNKKYSSIIKNNQIKTRKSAKDILTDKKIRNIQELTKHVNNDRINNLELSDFKTQKQRSVNIKYNNLNEKTKHYLDMR